MKIKLIVLILIIIFIFSFISCMTESEKTIASLEAQREAQMNEESPETFESVEYKMATIDYGYIGKNDPRISEYRILLDRLEEKTFNSRINISDITVTAQRLLNEKGINLSLLQILKDFDNTIPEDSPKLKLEEVASLYMVLMTN